jgi:hypothetical protein
VLSCAISSAPAEEDQDGNCFYEKEIDMKLNLTIEGKVLISIDVELSSLANLANCAEEDEPWHSASITVPQAKELIGLLDTSSVELLRQIVLAGGSIAWPKVQEIYGIEGNDFDQFLFHYDNGIKQALRTVTQGKHAWLITWEDGAPAWEAKDWKDAQLEIDGPALVSLTRVIGNQP